VRRNLRGLEAYLITYQQDDAAAVRPEDEGAWRLGRALVCELWGAAQELEAALEAALPPLGTPAPRIPSECGLRDVAKWFGV
jgi:hypothetical protein